MDLRILRYTGDGVAAPTDDVAPPDGGWVWVDVRVDPDDRNALRAIAEELGLDSLSVVDAIEDVDLPKVDDFGDQVLLVLHGLRDDAIATYEVDCFLQPGRLTTVRVAPSPSVDRLFRELQRRPELARGGADELAARLSDLLTRRLLAVVDAFDERVELSLIHI